jgi:hypothetical protein
MATSGLRKLGGEPLRRTLNKFSEGLRLSAPRRTRPERGSDPSTHVALLNQRGEAHLGPAYQRSRSHPSDHSGTIEQCDDIGLLRLQDRFQPGQVLLVGLPHCACHHRHEPRAPLQDVRRCRNLPSLPVVFRPLLPPFRDARPRWTIACLSVQGTRRSLDPCRCALGLNPRIPESYAAPSQRSDVSC